MCNISVCLHCTELCPTCAAYYGNRAAAFMMLSKFDRALDDARRATQIDATFVKVFSAALFVHK